MRRTLRYGIVAAAAGLGVAADPPPMPPSTPGVNTPGSPKPQPTNPNAALVNGEPVRLAEVDAVIKARFPVGPLSPAQLHQVRTEVANDLIDDLLVKQFLRRHGPKVEPAEVERHLKALASSLARQNKTLADYYRETDQTEAQVRESWTVLLQLSRYVRDHVKDDQLRQYYAANKDFFDRVEVRVSHVLIRTGPTATPAEKAAAREKLQALRADLLAGRTDFAAAARRHSQCPSALQGGDLGYILRKGMLTDEAFCQAAFALKTNELGDVVETPSGLHLIRVTDRKPGVSSTFEGCIEEVREAFTDDFRAELVGKLRKQAQIQLTVP
jgi:parvulin-like peptidyl-prolyl isomerase